jgi:hypothetical protein
MKCSVHEILDNNFNRVTLMLHKSETNEQNIRKDQSNNRTYHNKQRVEQIANAIVVEINIHNNK